MEEKNFETRDDWRKWLTDNHDRPEGIWLVYFKKHTKIPSVYHTEAVEEALCFGWIDSKIKSIDEQRYMQIFSPRNPKSIWSDVNKQRIEKMIHEGKLTSAGMKKVNDAKKFGQWDKSYGTRKTKVFLPDDLKNALLQNPLAWENFSNFPPSAQSTYIYWVSAAKRDETRKSRIDKVFEFSLKKIKPGIL